MSEETEINDKHRATIKACLPKGAVLISAELTDSFRENNHSYKRKLKNIIVIYKYNNEDYRVILSGHHNS